jgi:hypothetical protein
MAQITWNTMKLKNGLKVMPKVTSVTSAITNQSPLLIRNMLASAFVLFCEARYAEMPERKTKMGAQ